MNLRKITFVEVQQTILNYDIYKKGFHAFARTCLSNNDRDYMRAPKACYFVTSFFSFDNNSIIVTGNIEMIRQISPNLQTFDMLPLH